MQPRRVSDYDPLIQDGKVKTIKLTLSDADRASNVSLALRNRFKTTKAKGVEVRKQGAEVYVFPSKYATKE